MLAAGTLLEVQLPGEEACAAARVVRCSAGGQRCALLLLDTQEERVVNLMKCEYTVQQQEGPGAQDGSDDPGSSGSEGEEEEQQEGSSDGDGSEEEGSLGEADGDSEDQQEEGEEPDALREHASAAAAAVDAFASAAGNDPAAFLQPAAATAELARAAAKALYDYGAAVAGTAGTAAAPPSVVLPELYVDGFDPEQIWLQLELAAGPALKRARTLLRQAGAEPQLLTPETEEALDELLAGGSDSEEEGAEEDGMERSSDEEAGEEEEEEEEGGARGLEGMDYDALLAGAAGQQQQQRKRKEPESEGEEGDASEEGEEVSEQAEEEEQEQQPQKTQKRLRGAAARAAVEDQHFSLDDMEAFLQQAEREEMEDDAEGAGGGSDEDSDGDEGFDDAAGLASDNEEGGEGEDDDDDEDDSDADLEAALEHARKLAGKKASEKKMKSKKGGSLPGMEGSEDEDDDEPVPGAVARYEDFFGPSKPVAALGGRGRQQEYEFIEEQEEGAYDEDEDMSGEEEEEDDDDEGEAHRGARGSRRGVLEAGSSEEEEEDEEEEAQPSAHELRLAKMRDKIGALEGEAMGEKDWFMRGEVNAARRPKNSALEVDLDFETTVKPPPQPTEETRRSLEHLIKQRIAEQQFDGPVRIAPPPPDVKRTTVELDDSKPQQGLGELYEKDYVQAVTGAVEDKDEPVRVEARALFAALCGKLDALSHLHFRPKPSIEEVTVRVDVPAILMEEAAPQFVSEASMRAPEEVFRAEGEGPPQADGELSREERKRRRAKRKRGSKKRKEAKDEEHAARATTAGGAAPLAGRKSLVAAEAARVLEKAAKKAGKSGGKRGGKDGAGGGRGDYTKSAKVFARLQQERDGGGAAAAASGGGAPLPKASHLKL